MAANQSHPSTSRPERRRNPNACQNCRNNKRKCERPTPFDTCTYCESKRSECISATEPCPGKERKVVSVDTRQHSSSAASSRERGRRNYSKPRHAELQPKPDRVTTYHAANPSVTMSNSPACESQPQTEHTPQRTSTGHQQISTIAAIEQNLRLSWSDIGNENIDPVLLAQSGLGKPQPGLNLDHESGVWRGHASSDRDPST